MMRAAERVLTELVPDRRWMFVGGKGGVGKTTIAAALAIAHADHGRRTLIFSLDPAHSLGDALGEPLTAGPREVAGVPRLFAMEVDAARARAEWLSRFRAPLAQLLEGGTVLAAGEVSELLELSPPGMDELAGLLQLAGLLEDTAFERVVIDTAPTGHTLRLLESPSLATDWLRALEDLDAHRRAVAEAFTRRPLDAGDAVRRFLNDMQRDVEHLAGRLRNPARTGCVLVTTREPVVLAETVRYADALRRAHIAIAAVAVNRDAGIGAELPDSLRHDAPLLRIPRLAADPVGADALRDLARSTTLAAGASEGDDVAAVAPAHVAPGGGIAVGPRWVPPHDRRLYIVAGKGGVGKTTVASALALFLAAERARHTLLFSVDPAGSLGDVWTVAVGNDAAPSPATPHVHLRQVDAVAAWKAVSEAEAEELGSTLARVIGGGARDLPSRLPELTPPGVDELVSLIELTEQIGQGAYDAIVLDTAPTGHFLRLLEAPGLAREWAHAILRLMLRYRDAVPLGDTAERVLRFARNVKELESLMQDEERTFVTIVALPEALSVPETRRLLDRLASAGIHPGALLINRLLDGEAVVDDDAERRASELLSLPNAPPAVATPAFDQPPVGAEAIAELARGWRRISTDDRGAAAA